MLRGSEMPCCDAVGLVAKLPDQQLRLGNHEALNRKTLLCSGMPLLPGSSTKVPMLKSVNRQGL